MIAIDTNVLLRYLLDDDDLQAEKARRLFNANKKILITDVVLAETIWTLKGKRYNAKKEDLTAIVFGLLAEPHVVFENQQAVWYALNDYMNAQPIKTANGTKQADFADALISHKAQAVATQQGETYWGTYTFDKAALAINGTVLL